jgi:hypothetical protein
MGAARSLELRAAIMSGRRSPGMPEFSGSHLTRGCKNVLTGDAKYY